MQTQPTFLPVVALARLAQVNRSTVYRGLAIGALKPDAFVAEGNVAVPVFLPERAVDVVRLQTRKARGTSATKISNPCSCPEHRSQTPHGVEHRSAVDEPSDAANKQ